MMMGVSGRRVHVNDNVVHGLRMNTLDDSGDCVSIACMGHRTNKVIASRTCFFRCSTTSREQRCFNYFFSGL